MNDVIQWVVNVNWEAFVPTIAALLILARSIAHLTETKKDDEIVEKVTKYVTTVIKVLVKKPITTQAEFGALDKTGHDPKQEFVMQ